MNPTPLTDIGRVLRSSTRHFAFGTRVPEADMPVFGSFVKAAAQRGTAQVYGLIYDIAIGDDPLVKQLAMAEKIDPVIIADHRENRRVPIEVSVLAVGYARDGHIYHALPLQPPMALDSVFQCTPDEIRAFTERLDYLRLIIEARDIPNDELMAASIRWAALARPDAARQDFFVHAGQELSRLLSRDVTRLEDIVRKMKL